MKILSVDDVLVVRKMIKRVVEGMGGTLLEASGGLEAFNILDKNTDQVDLILLDWNMPNMNGYEFLSKVKSDSQHKKIPVIMVTNNSEKDKIIKAIQGGAANYLAKPFTEQDLSKKIIDCLGLGYESFITGCFSGAIKNILARNTGAEVQESKGTEEDALLGKDSVFSQIVLFGQKNAVVFLSAKKENAGRLITSAGRDSSPESIDTLASGFNKMSNEICSKALTLLAGSNTKLELTTPYIFGGSVDGYDTFIGVLKQITVIKKYTSGDIELVLKVIYF